RAQPVLTIDAARAFEGNAGTTVLQLPVRIIGPQPNEITGFVTAVSSTFVNSPPAATGGAACGGTVDFEQFQNIPFTIAPNTPNGTLSVNVAICGDNTIEADERIFVFFSGLSGALCLETSCGTFGTIVNDDGPPGISINNISVSTLQGVERNALFTVSLHHPSPSPVSVRYATRDGTARARTTTTLGSYVGTTGTLVIPAGALSGTIPVRILGTTGGTFFVDLSAPVNGTIADSIGQGTIRVQTLSVGSYDVAPDNARVESGETVNFALTWTAPDGEVWRDISTIDFRLRKGNNTALEISWDEAANTFSLCETTGKGREEKTCTEGELPGSASVLETSIAELHLAESSVVGSGPTGATVTLNFAVRFKDAAAGNYTVEVAAEDDFGSVDNFFETTRIHIDQAGKR
ncbi:MAG: hypothetical protein ACXW3Z_14750, partial [Limisphaerales bacterium]